MQHPATLPGIFWDGTERFLSLPYLTALPIPPSRRKKGDEGKVVLRYLESILADEHSGVDDPAGIIVEPIQGEGGYIVPPEDFLPGLREIADKYQIPLTLTKCRLAFDERASSGDVK